MFAQRFSSDRLQLTAAFKYYTPNQAALPAGSHAAVVHSNAITKKVRIAPYIDSEEEIDDESVNNHLLVLDFPAFSGGLILIHAWCAMPLIAIRTQQQNKPVIYGYPFADTLTQFCPDMGGLDYSLFTVKRFQSTPVIALPIPNVAGPLRIGIEGWGDPGPDGFIVEVYNPRRLPIVKGTCLPWTQGMTLSNNAELIYQAPSPQLSEYQMVNTMLKTPSININPDAPTTLGYVWFVGASVNLLHAHAALLPVGTIPPRELDFNSMVAESGAQVIVSPFEGGIAHWPEPVA